eukprot:562708-Alexandrium_andersonii.AAC.1
MDEAQVPEASAAAEQEDVHADSADPVPVAAQAGADVATSHPTHGAATQAASGDTGAARDAYDPWEEAPVGEAPQTIVPEALPSSAPQQAAAPAPQWPQPEAPLPQAATPQTMAQTPAQAQGDPEGL